MDRKTKYIISFLIVCFSIFYYGKYRCNHPRFKDPLERQYGMGLDGWSMSHFLFFLFLGYTFPDYIVISFLFGVTWELFEHYYGKKRPGWLGGYGDCKMITDRTDGNWWYGKGSDILLNGLGLVIGFYLQDTYSN